MPTIRNYTGSKEDVLPDDKQEKKGIGLYYPFGSTNRIFDVTNQTIEAARSNILSLFHTEEGERLMKPDVGIGLRKYCFEPITDNTADEIKEIIKEKINKYVPFVIIRNIDVSISDNQIDRNIINVSILFSLERQPEIKNELNYTVRP